jgi:hypothetical protein
MDVSNATRMNPECRVGIRGTHERFHGMEEVVSSNLARSTKLLKDSQKQNNPNPFFGVQLQSENWTPHSGPSGTKTRWMVSTVNGLANDFGA